MMMVNAIGSSGGFSIQAQPKHHKHGAGKLATEGLSKEEIEKTIATFKQKTSAAAPEQLQKLVDNFDKLDINGDGKVKLDEIKQNGQQFGIQPPPEHPPKGLFGPPPGFGGQVGTSANDTDNDSDHHHGTTGSSADSSSLKSLFANLFGPPPGFDEQTTGNTTSQVA
jgi:hypothetical protein